MESWAAHLQPLLAWLVRTTWQTSILIGLVLLIHKTLGRRLGVRGRYGLWMLVLLRMAMPWAIQSPASIHNLLPLPPGGPASVAGFERSDVRLAPAPPDRAGVADALAKADSPSSFESRIGLVTSLAARTGRWLQTRTPVALSLTWLVGAGCLAGCIAAGNVRLGRMVRRGRPVTDRWILGILQECQGLIRTRAAVEVIATDEVPCPALCGWLRPRLLLPKDTLAERDRSALRHIFLHELAHLKRHDIFIGYLAGALHVVHWFNPLVALGLRRMRADRELACDGLALSVLTPEETTAYGRTIVHQVERLLLSQPRWMMAGLCGDRARIRQRIAMISRFQGDAYRRCRLTVVLAVCLACVGLTDGLTAETVERLGPGRVLPTTHQDEHANIIRVYIRHIDTGKFLTADGDTVACDAGEPGDAGLWEARFDDDLGGPDHRAFLYSVAANAYLASDDQGNLTLSRPDPDDAGRWIVWARPQGVWLISEAFANGYVRLAEDGRVRAATFGRDARSYWDVQQLWRVKTSDDPESNPQWRRHHVPGPD